MASSKRVTKSGVAPKHDHSNVLTKDGQINVSQSKVKVWRQCRRMYHNKFVLMLQKKLRKRPLMFGSLVHEIIEAHFEGEDWNKKLDKIQFDNKKLFKREIEMYGNIVEDIRDIMTDYFKYWEGSVKAIPHDDRHSEYEFRIELAPGLWFTGKIDAVVKSKKMRWLMEHKTFSRMPSEDERWRSVQSAVYFRALDEMGFPPMDGILWDYVSSKAPMTPGQLTATGRISKAKIDTVPTRLRRWIKDEGHDRAEYKGMIDAAKENLSNRFIRLYSPLKQNVAKTIWDDFVETALEIQQYHGTKKDQNVGRHCSWCDYQPLCKAEAVGADVDWLVDREYQLEDQSHKSEKILDEE